MNKKLYSLSLHSDDVQKTLRRYGVDSLAAIHSVVQLSGYRVLVTFIGTKPEEEDE